MERKQYNILLNSYFDSKKGRKLTDLGLEHIGVAMYLLTVSSQVGLTHITKESLISKFKISKRKLNGFFADLEEIGFMKYCDKFSVLYVIDMLAINVKATSNQNTQQARILRAQLALIDNECDLKKELCIKYKDTHPAIINKNLIKEKEDPEEIEKDEKFNGIQAIHTYNLATEGKGYQKARITKNTKNEMSRLIKRGMEREDLINYCITLEFNNIRELIEEIKHDLELQELETLIDSNEATEATKEAQEEAVFNALSLDSEELEESYTSESEAIESKENPIESNEIGELARRQQKLNEEKAKKKKILESTKEDEIDEWF